jgi:hypothetical protein
MEHENWVTVEVVSGDLQAEILRGLLESYEIPVSLSQEGAGKAIGLSVGPLGEVEILVPASRQDQARKVIDDYYAGSLTTDEEFDEEQGDQPPD